jgi:hypothetical protein
MKKFHFYLSYQGPNKRKLELQEEFKPYEYNAGLEFFGFDELTMEPVLWCVCSRSSDDASKFLYDCLRETKWANYMVSFKEAHGSYGGTELQYYNIRISQ